jgi:hypothetical protein
MGHFPADQVRSNKNEKEKEKEKWERSDDK